MASPSAKGKAKTEEREEGGVMESLAVVGVAVGVAAVAWWGLSKLLGGGGQTSEKMMKAPGKEFFIPRKEFESNPADWFRNHRS